MAKSKEKKTGEPAEIPAAADRFVVFLRHGLAEERSEEKPDEDRTLTPEGHSRTKQIARGLAEIFPKADAIYTSPLVRCVQTALWVSKAYRGKLEPVSTPALRSEASAEETLQFLESLEERRAVLVGHEPNLSSTVARLIGAQQAEALALKKGGCYGLRIGPEGAVSVEWSLPPKVLRRLG